MICYYNLAISLCITKTCPSREAISSRIKSDTVFQQLLSSQSFLEAGANAAYLRNLKSKLIEQKLLNLGRGLRWI